MWTIYEGTEGTGNTFINNWLRGFRRLDDSRMMHNCAEDLGRVKFDAVRLGRMHRLSELVELLCEPVGLSFEDRDTPEYEILLVRVVCGP